MAALDATGAGDCCAGVLVTRLVAGDPLVSAARAACVATALGTTGYGALSALPTWPQIAATMSASA